MGWPFLRGQARDLRKDSLKGNIKIDREREREIYIYILQARETRVSWADRETMVSFIYIIGEAAWWTTVCHLSVRGNHGLLQSWLADYGLLSQ